MVSVSHESSSETEHRLRNVLREARFTLFEGLYSWEELAFEEFPRSAKGTALALVRDDECWSQLVPATGRAGELFRVFRFEFEAGCDNSGFVGWLASLIKSEFGAGLFVTCGNNARRGGIYDYWGCPAAVSDEVLAEIDRMRGVPG